MTMCFWERSRVALPTKIQALCGRFDYQLTTGKWGFEAGFYLMIHAKTLNFVIFEDLKHELSSIHKVWFILWKQCIDLFNW